LQVWRHIPDAYRIAATVGNESASMTPSHDKKPRHLLAWVSIAAVLVAAGAFHMTGWAKYAGPVGHLRLDLAKPDGLIVTKSLSKLPRDLLRVPLLKDLLTRDLAFYYEHNEDRLSLSGSLRRISFENDLQWNDRLLEHMMDEPAELAFWRNAKNSAEYTLVAMTRNSLAKIVQQAAAVALKDRQLSIAAQIKVDGESVPVFALGYGRDRTVLIASKGDRLVALSHPGMLLSGADQTDAGAEAVLAKLLSSAPEAQQIYRRALSLPDSEAEHRVVASARFLSLGYQHFFPDLEALRLDFAGGEWSMQAKIAADAAALFPATNVLSALPARPAACAALPVDWKKFAAFAAKSGKMPAPPPFTGPVAACWYAGWKPNTPLFAAELAADADGKSDAALKDAFAFAIAGSDEAAADAGKDAVVLQRRAKAARAPEQPGGEHYFLTTLARHGRFVLFSPDAKLVRQGLDTVERRYPSVADSLPKDATGATVMVLTPKALSELAMDATLGVLEQQSLNDAVRTQLAPRLKAIEKYPAYRVSMLPAANSAGTWQPVRWEALAAQP
jgi:uncharacterized protein YfaA (DUF2138 family)